MSNFVRTSCYCIPFLSACRIPSRIIDECEFLVVFFFNVVFGPWAYHGEDILTRMKRKHIKVRTKCDTQIFWFVLKRWLWPSNGPCSEAPFSLLFFFSFAVDNFASTTSFSTVPTAPIVFTIVELPIASLWKANYDEMDHLSSQIWLVPLCWEEREKTGLNMKQQEHFQKWIQKIWKRGRYFIIYIFIEKRHR